MIDTHMALTGESGLDQPLCARRDRFLGLFSHRTPATGLYPFYDEGFAPGIAKTEGYFQLLPFLDLAEIPGGIHPLHRREVGGIPADTACGPFVIGLVIALAADQQDRGY